MRNINIETYWKMMNSFWYRSKKKNPYSIFKQKLLNATDETLNSMTIEEWNKYSLSEDGIIDSEEIRDLKDYALNEGGMTEEEKIDRMAFISFKGSQEIFYNRSVLNSPLLISMALAMIGKITLDNIEELKDFIFLTEMKMIDTNSKEGKDKKKVNINFSPITFKAEEEWIVDILAEIDMFGFKLVIKRDGKLILPFWDWTMSLVFDSLNRFMAQNNTDGHNIFIETIQSIAVENWEPQIFKANKEYKYEGRDGEIDFAFVKNGILYMFENKNIIDMHNPTEKNWDVYKRWRKSGIDKGVSQLGRAVPIAHKIFPDWKFSKVVPILCTTSRNRLENSNVSGIEVDDPFVFMDLDSLMFLLNLKRGYEAILFMSYFAKKKNRTGLFDMVDVVGILTDAGDGEKEIAKYSMNFDKGYLLEHFEGISNTSFPLGEHDHLMGSWEGDYRPLSIKILKDYKDAPILLGSGFMRAFNNFNSSKRVKITKYIFGSDAYYDKYTDALSVVGLIKPKNTKKP